MLTLSLCMHLRPLLERTARRQHGSVASWQAERNRAAAESFGYERSGGHEASDERAQQE